MGESCHASFALQAAGVESMWALDHEFCKSIYFRDPNGILLEFSTWVRELDESDLDDSVPAKATPIPRPVAVPAGLPASDIWLMTVRGPSLSDFQIFDGDQLVITKVYSTHDVDADTIFAVFIHATGELVARRRFFTWPIEGLFPAARALPFWLGNTTQALSFFPA